MVTPQEEGSDEEPIRDFVEPERSRALRSFVIGFTVVLLVAVAFGYLFGYLTIG
jgi:hypothetical protein